MIAFRTRLCLLCSILGLLPGCVSAPAKKREPRPLPKENREMVVKFLDALYRPKSSSRKIAIDEKEEEMERGDGLTVRQRKVALRSRLRILRAEPKSVIRVTVFAVEDRDWNADPRAERPPRHPSSDYWTIDYDRSNGRIDVHSEVEHVYPYDLSLELRWWPDRRLICVSYHPLPNFRDDIFHLVHGERVYRFVVPSDMTEDLTREMVEGHRRREAAEAR